MTITPTKAVIGVAAVGAVIVASLTAQVSYTELARALNPSQTDSFDSCPMVGGNPKESASSLLKNRHTTPPTINPSLTLDVLAKASANTTIDQDQGATIEGYLVLAKSTGPEACNCNSRNPDDWDFHCYIGPRPDSPERDCVVVEVTPRMRFWSLAQLKAHMGQRVRCSGWLFLDEEHKASSVADSPGNARDWRASCWEIHPVCKWEFGG